MAQPLRLRLFSMPCLPPVGGVTSLQLFARATGVGLRVQNRRIKGGIKQGPVGR